MEAPLGLIISNTTSGTLPTVPFLRIKEAILGKRYSLSLTFLGEKRSRDLNQETRGKDYATNVLSFPLGEDMGEIYLTPKLAKREAHKFSMDSPTYLAYLFIHGCLHLKGFEHGEAMDRAEQKYLKKFDLA